MTQKKESKAMIELARKSGFHVEYTCNGKGRDYIIGDSKSLNMFALNLMASPISQNEQQEAVGYIDEFGNFENSVKQWMIDEPDVKWKPLYTSPPKQAIPEDVIKDAKRYNWLKQNYHGFEMFRHSTIPYVTLDREVDKAMLNAAPTTSLTSETNMEVGE